MPSMKWLRALAFVATILLPLGVSAEVPWVFTDDTRYMAMGDSLAAGYGAIPATQGYAYLLYKEGVFDKIPNTLLSNVGLIGATSQDVLEKQVPLAIDPFEPLGRHGVGQTPMQEEHTVDLDDRRLLE